MSKLQSKTKERAVTGFTEAIQWIEEAEERLDQAHANLKDLGMSECVSRGNRLTIANVANVLEALRVALKEEAEEAGVV